MKAVILIPKGWRRIRRGNIRDGDRSLNPFRVSWDLVHPYFTGNTVRLCAFLIRRT